MIRRIALTAAAAALAAAPVAAQAAPQRAATPVSAQSEELRGGFFLPAVIAIGFLIVLFLAIDSEDDLPHSP